MKNYEHIPELIYKKISETINKEELQKLENWINASEENKRIYKGSVNENNIKEALRKYFKYDMKKAWLKIEKRLLPNERRINSFSKKLLRYAAIIAVPLLIAVYLFFHFKTLNVNNRLSHNNIEVPFEPGKQKAFLILGSGEKIAVGNHVHKNNIKLSESVEIIDTNNTLLYETEKTSPNTIEYNTLQTPKGGEYKVVLSDGSKVWLNADSKLIYPISFPKTERKVFIEGEAYFEVTKNKNRPFIVETKSYNINVLGTSFNVMTYRDEPEATTTLVEGSVEITKSEFINPVLLSPGQQVIIYNESNNVELKPVDTHQYTAWKDGLFVFKSETLGSLTRKLSRWYNCKIQFTNAELTNRRFTGTLKRDTDLDNLLDIISQTCQIDFYVDNNNVLLISKKNKNEK